MLLPSLLSVQFQLRCRAKFSGRSSCKGSGMLCPITDDENTTDMTRGQVQ